MPRVLSPLGQTWLDDIPAQFRDDPDIKASIDVQAREMQRLWDRMDAITNGFFPALDTAGNYLHIWEALMNLPINPPGYTAAQRQARDLASLQSLGGGSTGLAFEAAARAIVGSGFSYLEHTASNGVPDVTIRVTLGVAATSQQAQDLYNLLRAILPAHIGLSVNYGVGFVVGVSHVGLDSL